MDKKKMNKIAVGVWIDHREAVIVLLRDLQEEIKQVASEAESQLRRTGDEPLSGKFDPHQVPADDSRQRDYSGHLTQYFNEVVALLRSAQSIFIFGPGEAKAQLKKLLEKENLGGRVVGLETADKMTVPQIRQKVRKYFLPAEFV
ncbi:MAG: hypothetical protein L7F78_18720 [Syntrophales bacterium LBB04]|nr:hypothetical protein [Syntrophales bacterium LBB04]